MNNINNNNNLWYRAAKAMKSDPEIRQAFYYNLISLLCISDSFCLFAHNNFTYRHILNSHAKESWEWGIFKYYYGSLVGISADFTKILLKSIKENLVDIRSFGNAQVPIDINYDDSTFRVVIQPLDSCLYAYHLVTIYKLDKYGKRPSKNIGVGRNVDTYIISEYNNVYSCTIKEHPEVEESICSV